MRHLLGLIVAASFLFAGCSSSDNSTPVAAAPKKPVERKPLSMGGAPPPQDSGDSNADADDGSDDQAEAPRRSTPKGMRPGDNLRMGGGGGGTIAVGGPPTTANRGPGRSNNNNSNNNASTPAAPTTTIEFVGGGFNNGLFPQPLGTPYNFEETMENALFPQNAKGGKSEFVSIPAPILPSVRMMAQAVEAFEKRNEKDGFKYLYGHLLTSDKAREKYPVKWFPGIKSPKPFFRWGVGVIYNPAKGAEDEAPFVIGDPEGSRERESSNDRRGNNRRGSGRSSGRRGGSNGFGNDDGGRRPPSAGGGASAGGDSPYVNVATDHPEGFLLYYTGDFGDKLLTQLEERLKDDEGFYGDILRDLEIDYSNESVSSSAPRAPANNNRGGQRAGDNLSAGGGAGGGFAGGGGRRPAAGGGGGGSSRVNRVSTGSKASKPSADTVGTLTPGVMLVGRGKRDELIEKSKNLGLDGLLLFSVRVQSGRKAVGSAGLKLINLHTDDPAKMNPVSTRNLRTDKVVDEREKEGRTDPVDLAVNEIFDKGADTDYRSTSLPSALEKKAVVEKRVTKIASENKDNPLPAAYEIVSYHQLGLLDEKPAISALNKLFGKQVGENLINGDEKLRYRAIANYVSN